MPEKVPVQFRHGAASATHHRPRCLDRCRPSLGPSGGVAIAARCGLFEVRESQAGPWAAAIRGSKQPRRCRARDVMGSWIKETDNELPQRACGAHSGHSLHCAVHDRVHEGENPWRRGSVSTSARHSISRECRPPALLLTRGGTAAQRRPPSSGRRKHSACGRKPCPHDMPHLSRPYKGAIAPPWQATMLPRLVKQEPCNRSPV